MTLRHPNINQDPAYSGSVFFYARGQSGFRDFSQSGRRLREPLRCSLNNLSSFDHI